MLKLIMAAVVALATAPGAALALSANADVFGAQGTVIGKLTLETAVGGVLMRLDIDKNTIEPGWHGMHFHAIGDCSDTGVFKKSGGHIGKKEGAHGLRNVRGPEAGDLPNIYVPHMHATRAEIFVPWISLLPGGAQYALFDEDGTALIIHANEDDHRTQPIGGAGGRVACAPIK